MSPVTRRLVLTAVLVSSATFPLTITGTSVALPGLRADLDASLAAAQWVVNGYNALFASLLVFAGSLADLLGRRRIFAAGLLLFCAAGVISAMAGDVATLAVARAVAGAGAAAATIGGSALLAATFDDRGRARAFGLLGSVLGGGLAFGPTLSGLLVDGLGWRAVFAVPAGIAAVALLLVPALPAAPGASGRRLDWRGAGLFTGALLLLVVALVEGPERGFASPVVPAVGLTALVLAAACVRVERRTQQPLFDLELLGNRRFRGLAVAAGALMGVLVPLLVYLPSYLIEVVGIEAGRAGLWMLLLTAPAVALPSLGARIAERRPTALVTGSVALAGAGALLLVTIGPDSTAVTLAPPFLLIGAGVGLSTGVLDGMAVATVTPDRAGTASGLFNTARLGTETVALAVAGAVLAAVAGDQLAGAPFTDGLRILCLGLAGLAGAGVATVAVLARVPDEAATTE